MLSRLGATAGHVSVWVVGLTAVLLAPGPAARGADVLDGLGGTWGLPPIDGKPGLTGSYLSLYRNQSGGLRASLDLNPGDWSCRADLDVTWNQGAARLEWPNRSSVGAGGPCWLQASPLEGRLDLRIWCPYECTGGEVIHPIRLERIAVDRLVPPENVVDTFCSSHDALRQELCRPGDLQKLIAEGNLAARQRGVLAEGMGDVPLLPDTDQELRSILDKCRAAGGGRPCLRQALQERREAAAAAVAARQEALAEERRQSEAAAVALPAPKAWEGTWSLVSDEMIGTLTVDSCETKGCALTIEGQTNYSFGYQERHGTCTLTYNRLVFIGEDRGYSYVEPGDRERDAEGAGPFANLCRIDLARTKDGFRVALRGVGCANACTEAQFPGLAGEYHARPQPSFACPPETSDLAWDEANLCLDPELAALDRELASTFGKAKAGASGAARTSLVRAQRAWVATRRRGCDGGHRRTCLVEAYRKRLQELQ